MNVYSPFEEDLEQLQTSDLASLTEAAEGWYIEYKREVPNATTIAKSVSAFANTQGGWLFIAVEEKSKTEPVAGSFPGIARPEVDSGLQRIRQAVAHHVMPSPHYDARVLWGPCDAIGLSAGRAVICVRVPRSIATPHVHRNGHIYLRIADGSEPRPENDRFVLDQLWRRADDLRKEYRRMIEQDPDLSDAEARWPFMRLLVICDLWDHDDPWAGISLDEFRELMSETKGFSIPFDNVYTDQHGFVARQIGTNDPIKLGLTWRFRQNLISEIWISANCCRIDDPKSVEYFLSGYEGAPQFIEIMRRQGFKTGRVIDLNLLFGLIWGLVQKQHHLLRRADWKDGYFCKWRLLNVSRTFPFLDIGLMMSHFEKHGIPVCLDRLVTSPPGTDPETFVEVPATVEVPANSKDLIPAHLDADSLFLWLVQAVRIFKPVAQAFGLPTGMDFRAEEAGKLYSELFRSMERALEVQRMHSERGR